MTPSIPLPDMDRLDPEVRAAVASLPMNVFKMAANAPGNVKPFLELAKSVLFSSAFDPRKREIAVLRVAHVTHALYGWTHHVTLAKNYKVTESEIKIIQAEDPVVSLGAEGNLLCRVADEISRNVRLSDDALVRILEYYGTQGATELVLCVSYFNFLSRFLESTRVELEENFRSKV
jgi:4-carboxymuconolactone decarboxylase